MASEESKPHYVPPQISAVLEPFLERQDWTLHYPLYVNTFCLAYHLAALVASRRSAAAMRAQFIRHDWAHGTPAFTYRTDIELFVGVRETLERLEHDGHGFDSFQTIAFTGYSLKRIFVRRERPAAGPMLLITDVRRNARRLLQSWEDGQPDLGDFGTVDLDPRVIRDSRDRGLHDFFDNYRKIYLFSAPTEWLLKLQAGNKYVEREIPAEVIDTAYLFRCNEPVDEGRVRSLRNAVQAYYRLLYSGETERFVSADMADHYGRLANSAGQPNPFPEVMSLLPQGKNTLTQKWQRRLAEDTGKTLKGRYVEILKEYHEQPTSEELR